MGQDDFENVPWVSLLCHHDGATRVSEEVCRAPSSSLRRPGKIPEND